MAKKEEHIKLTFLGTGTSTGVPVIACDCPVCMSDDSRDKRLRTSAMVEVNGNIFIFDCGPDFRYQMIREKVKDIHALLFTHEHRDHIAGIDDIRAFNYVLNKRVETYATEQVMNSIRTQFPYIFDTNGYFGAPKISVHTIDDNPFVINNIEIIPIRVFHDKLPVTGFRIGGLSYITDASYIPRKEKAKIAGSDVLVINALRKSIHISHFSLEQVVDLVKELQPKQAYITHMSHYIGLQKDLEAELPSNIQPAYDGLVVEVP